MCGWSIIARACRSASNRAITATVSIPQVQNLDRNPPHHRGFLIRHVHGTEAPVTHLLEELAPPIRDPTASGPEPPGPPIVGADRKSGSLAAAVGDDSTSSARLRVARAGSVQICGPLALGQRGHLGKSLRTLLRSCMRLIRHFPEQPRCVRTTSAGRPGAAEPHRPRRFIHAQAREEPQPHNTSDLRLGLLQALERLRKSAPESQTDHSRRQGPPPATVPGHPPTTLDRALGAGVVDEDPAHGLRRGGKEVPGSRTAPDGRG